ncbi:hypothetical protein PspLS_05259, partial [Pyricularia sp. CBS 133598]
TTQIRSSGVNSAPPGNACNAQILDARDRRQNGGSIVEMKRFMWEGMMFGPIGTIHRPHCIYCKLRIYQQYSTGPGIGCEIVGLIEKPKMLVLLKRSIFT